ncbi:MAG: hypothetical protein NTZ68_03010 [Candidatus Dependentiae bacterium]|nr:hypothetical protein [Candidatus Dependentiae bacterium]
MKKLFLSLMLLAGVYQTTNCSSESSINLRAVSVGVISGAAIQLALESMDSSPQARESAMMAVGLAGGAIVASSEELPSGYALALAVATGLYLYTSTQCKKAKEAEFLQESRNYYVSSYNIARNELTRLQAEKEELTRSLFAARAEASSAQVSRPTRSFNEEVD